MEDEQRTGHATVPNLPADRTFVVQFRAAIQQVASDPIRHGRVEHLVSGLSTRFDTWPELEQFVEHVLLNTKPQTTEGSA